MLTPVFQKVDEKDACFKIKDASFPNPFDTRLEYSCPARGPWNIVHVGMLIPEAHQIYVCCQGCLRGVVLTAAEVNSIDRFSTIAIREENIVQGQTEDLIVDGVENILGKLPYTPKAILLFTNCIHYFIGTDLPSVYKRLREKFPHIEFTDCYMNPIMKKRVLTPEQMMQKQLCSLWDKTKLNKKSINIIGNNHPTDENSELITLIKDSGYELKDITLTKTYQEYKDMAESFMNIYYNPVVKAGAEELKKRLGQEYLYIPLSFGFDEIENNLNLLCETLNVPKRDWSKQREKAEKSLLKAKEIIGNTEINIDYTFSTRPLSLAHLLLEHRFNVKSIYLDAMLSEEEADFKWLQENYPDIKLYATIHVKMRVLDRHRDRKILAIGQKAAYFNSTKNFVNIVEGGGMYGFSGIVKLSNLMIDAFENEKDTKSLIQIKGLGCEG